MQSYNNVIEKAKNSQDKEIVLLASQYEKLEKTLFTYKVGSYMWRRVMGELSEILIEVNMLI